MPGKHTLSDPATAVHIREILPPERITLKLTVAGKQDLFGQLGALLSRDVAGLDRQVAQNSLIEREQLGSTGIGRGIALPHGRLPGLARSIGACHPRARDGLRRHRPQTCYNGVRPADPGQRGRRTSAYPVPAGGYFSRPRNEARAACGANHGRNLPVLRTRRKPVRSLIPCPRRWSRRTIFSRLSPAH